MRPLETAVSTSPTICSTPAALSLGGYLPKSTASSQFRQASNPTPPPFQVALLPHSPLGFRVCHSWFSGAVQSQHTCPAAAAVAALRYVVGGFLPCLIGVIYAVLHVVLTLFVRYVYGCGLFGVAIAACIGLHAGNRVGHSLDIAVLTVVDRSSPRLAIYSRLPIFRLQVVIWW